MLIVALNVKFHLFQKLTDLFTVVIVSEKTNHKITNMRNFQETTEESLAETKEENHVVMTEESLAETTAESQDVMTEENLVETNLEN